MAMRQGRWAVSCRDTRWSAAAAVLLLATCVLAAAAAADPRVEFFLRSRRHLLGGHKNHPSARGRLGRYKLLGNRLFSDQVAREQRRNNPDVQVFEEMLLRTIATHGPLRDAMFSFSFADTPDACGEIEVKETSLSEPAELRIPCLSYATTSKHRGIPVPFISHYSQAKKPPPSTLLAEHPWSTKRGTLYFRGTLTGWQGPLYNVSLDPSYALIRANVARIATEEVWGDISLVYFDDEAANDAKRAGLKDAKLLVEAARRYIDETMAVDRGWPQWLENAQHKYLLALDGVTFCGRLVGLLRYGGVVLRNRSPFQDIATPVLEPGKNIVEFAPDLSGFVATMERLRADDNAARQIALAGAALWELYFSMSGLLKYMADLVTALHEFYREEEEDSRGGGFEEVSSSSEEADEWRRVQEQGSGELAERAEENLRDPASPGEHSRWSRWGEVRRFRVGLLLLLLLGSLCTAIIYYSLTPSCYRRHSICTPVRRSI